MPGLFLVPGVTHSLCTSCATWRGPEVSKSSVFCSKRPRLNDTGVLVLESVSRFRNVSVSRVGIRRNPAIYRFGQIRESWTVQTLPRENHLLVAYGKGW